MSNQVSRTESSMRRRDAFVAEIAKTIQARHGHTDESFVFGLSGRWGEGKSHFLRRLSQDLRDLGFETVELNPWKYSSDRVAFLRSFLVRLLETQSSQSRLHAAKACVASGEFAHAWQMVLPRRIMLASLKTDVSRQRIAWPRLIVLILLALLGYWTYSHVISPSAQAFVSDWKILLTAILFPVLIWVVQGLVSSQISSKAATTVDQFDELVSLALGGSPKLPLKGVGTTSDRRIVVFVDDLDRVTAEVARGVLDNLRTFFDKPAISFVVTGDHTVLEASLGRELLPEQDADVADRMEQGRRFLKKVFNLYWRLPLPVRSDFEEFVNGELLMRQEELHEMIPEPSDQAILRKWLLGYCDLNARQVIRTIDTLLFTLRLVRAQLANATSDEKTALAAMVDQPMLLGRILVIQDRCAPFFERLVEAPSLLRDLDRSIALAQSDSDGTPDIVGEFLQQFDTDGRQRTVEQLSPEQRRFLTGFAYEPPLFWDPARGGQVVANLGPWIHLAGDLNFVDSSGPQPEDFIRDLANKNRESLTADFNQCSGARAPDVAELTIGTLGSMADLDERGQELAMLLSIAARTEPGKPLAAEILSGVIGALDVLLAGLSDEWRVSVLVDLAGVLDSQGEKQIPDDAAAAFGFRSASDLQYLPKVATGPLGSGFMLDWLRAYDAQNSADCLRYLEDVLPFVAPEADASVLEQLGQELVNDIMVDDDETRRDRRFALVLECVPQVKPFARATVLDHLEVQSVWDWASRAAAASEGLWSLADIQQTLAKWVAKAPDQAQLLQRLRYAASKIDGDEDGLWDRLREDRLDDVLALLDSFGRDAAFSSIAPPRRVATALYEARAQTAAESDDESAAVSQAQILIPSLPLWVNIDRKRARKSLQQMARLDARRKQLQAAVRPYWDSLGVR